MNSVRDCSAELTFKTSHQTIPKENKVSVDAHRLAPRIHSPFSWQ